MQNKHIYMYIQYNRNMSFPPDQVTRHFIKLYITMVFQYLESTLHTFVVHCGQPRTSFQVVRNNHDC